MVYSSTVSVKQETLESSDKPGFSFPSMIQMIRTNGDEGESAPKKARLIAEGILGFLQSPPPEMEIECPDPISMYVPTPARRTGCRQFWKAGDFEANPGDVINADFSSVGMDHVRVHPKFLHSNATSHKWALGAFAELLDNSIDEICNGATYVNVDMLKNEKNGSNMLVVEDDGGGMTPEKMRNCMSLGYSSKSKQANTIGQYGNGFKTSTMRLGADAIVFSRCQGTNNTRATQTIGMLSYTFLTSTGKEDIVVPMIDYERTEQGWKMIASPNYVENWNINLGTIVDWSPYFSEEHLLQQFNFVKERGTRVIIYNLWEDDQGLLELDFDADPSDIQIRINRDETKIQMENQYPNSRHFLTYRHSFRSYASILYLRLPPMFRMILRGKEIEHHRVEDDMMLTKKMTYRPMLDGVAIKDSNIYADVTVGFVKDAHYHIDVQGFNVYHKNRLIKPFWRVWNAAGSNGRGVIGVLEANFVEPAHDKQGFERTTVLSRLEQRLVSMQKSYWSSNCQKVGYAGNVSKRTLKPTEQPVPQKTDGSSSGKMSRSATTQPRRHIVSEQRSMGNGDEHPVVVNLVNDIKCEKERGQGLEANLQMVEVKVQELDNEKLALIDMLDEERKQRDTEEGRLVTKLNEAYKTIDDLRERVRQLETETGLISCKEEQLSHPKEET